MGDECARLLLNRAIGTWCDECARPITRDMLPLPVSTLGAICPDCEDRELAGAAIAKRTAPADRDAAPADRDEDEVPPFKCKEDYACDICIGSMICTLTTPHPCYGQHGCQRCVDDEAAWYRDYEPP